MTVMTETRFDIEEFKRSYEQWDVPALLALYAEDVELIQIDREHPPATPRVRSGRDNLAGMFEHCAAAGVTATVENGVAADGRAAATIVCDFPGGRRVVANAILEVEDGRITREHDVLAGDPRS